MPVVTDIQQQKKDNSRYSVYIDGEYVFGLDGLDFSASSLRIGQELTTNEIEDWQSRSAEGKAYNAAVRYLSYRQRSQAEVRKYLQDKEYDDATTQLTIDKLLELGMIDDAAFAASWISDRMRLKPRSRFKLVAELRQKGIDPDTIEVALSELGRDDELAALRGIIAKKRRSYDSEAKLVQYLCSLGYSYGLIKEAMDDEII
jgi:regulatory protein